MTLGSAYSECHGYPAKMRPRPATDPWLNNKKFRKVRAGKRRTRTK